MKKILLLRPSPPPAPSFAKKKIDEGKARAGPLGRGDRHGQAQLTCLPGLPVAHRGPWRNSVAHLLCKQGVRGSSPLGSTRRNRRSARIFS